MEISEITKLFQDEFGILSDKFKVFEKSLTDAKASQEDGIFNPGVYVFWCPSKVIKLGRHLTNSRMRAFQHIDDNTGGIMKVLPDNKQARLLLFNVKCVKDRHWVAALEIYFEQNLCPQIRSKRN